MPISRRDFLKSGAAAIAGFTIAPSSILGKSHGHISPTDKLNIGVVGIGGIGHSNINAVKDTENIVALCDVNWDYAKGVFDEFPRQSASGTIARCTRRWERAWMPSSLQRPTTLMPSSQPMP